MLNFATDADGYEGKYQLNEENSCNATSIVDIILQIFPKVIVSCSIDSKIKSK